MLTVNEAIEQIITTVAPFPVSQAPLNDAIGLTLAHDIHSNTDLPPFDKALMDGYAVRSADVPNGTASLSIIDVVTAGQISAKHIESGQAIQIMTGAPIPQGADAVVKIEETTGDSDRVSIATKPLLAGTNLIRRGTSVHAGDCVLREGLTLNGARIGALAELGCTHLPVRRRPRVAILATGDELVPVEAMPGPGQIRNSNESMLAAQVVAAGGIAVPLGIARDDRDELRALIQQGLQSDLLVLSGGVSAGILDLVPSVLAEAGVREVFHKVEMKPGKPIWFGVGGCYVFGLPGNPVSSLVCFELFVRTAIKRMMGVDPPTPQPVLAALEHEYTNRNDRPTYHPARLTQTKDGLMVTLVPWHGSSDLCGTVMANGMALLTVETRQLRAGDRLETYRW